VNALTDPQVGRYLNRHYVSAFQKVATFRINGGQKQGGNVAAYFCTPAGLVLHAVAGPVNAATFQREAQWANDVYHLARLESDQPDRLQAFVRKAHLARLQGERRLRLDPDRLPGPDDRTAKQLDWFLQTNGHLRLNNQGKVHLLLAAGPMVPLGQVYQVVFERVLNERISTEPVAVVGGR
jgi:hypothetical protein